MVVHGDKDEEDWVLVNFAQQFGEPGTSTQNGKSDMVSKPTKSSSAVMQKVNSSVDAVDLQAVSASTWKKMIQRLQLTRRRKSLT